MQVFSRGRSAIGDVGGAARARGRIGRLTAELQFGAEKAARRKLTELVEEFSEAAVDS
jgi:methyl coenzyme M reductase subunit C-like uncharacterized protein (methanogenesis marker protein 7)